MGQRFQFKDEAKPQLMRLREAFEIKLAEGEAAPKVSDVQVLRCGAFDHPWYGTMLITPMVLSDMVKNFDNRVRRQDISFDFFHESEGVASGWPTKLYLADNGQALFATTQWTPKAQQMLADKEVRYFSADFVFEWTDPETGVSYKNVLFGGGLVNRPFVKDMQPVIELSEGTNQMKTVEQLNAEITKLSEGHAAAIKQLAETKDAEIAEIKGKLALSEKNGKEAKEAAALAAKEKQFSDLCVAGKACAAQKEAFMSVDMVKFAELAKPVNVVTTEDETDVIELGEGKGGKAGEGAKLYELSEQEKQICKTFGLTQKEFCEGNPKK